MRAGSLFTGTGALDMAAAEVLGAEPAWFCEYEPPTEKEPRPEQGGAKLLSYRYPHIPNHGDITAVDWDQVEPIDILAGGFPCTDLSLAGAQAGLKPGTRSGLWTQFAYAISKLRPQVVLIENVRGLASAEAHSDLEPCPWCVGDQRDEPVLRAFGAVLGDLADLGYDAVWCGVRASDVGAPHGRFRFFVAAARHTEVRGRDDTPVAGQRRRSTGATGGPGVAPPDAGGDAIREQPVAESGRGGTAVAGLDHAAAAYADGGGLAGHAELDLGTEGGIEASRRLDTAGRVLEWGPYEPAIRRWERILGRPAPEPTLLSEQYLKRLARHQEFVGRRRAGLDTRPVGMRGSLLPPREVKVLNPALPEWMMGLPDGWITAVPGLSRAAQLKLAGNGVVPQQAIAAFRYLLDLERAA